MSQIRSHLDILRDAFKLIREETSPFVYVDRSGGHYECTYCDFKSYDPFDTESRDEHRSDPICPYGRIISELEAWIRVEESLEQK